MQHTTTQPRLPSSKRQEEYQSIIDDPASTIRKDPIIQNNDQCFIAQQAVAKEQIRNGFYNQLLRFRPNLLDYAGEYVDFP